jgi:hypothetical protein
VKVKSTVRLAWWLTALLLAGCSSGTPTLKDGAANAYAQTADTRVSGARRDVVRELANAESADGNFETAIELMQQAIREVPKSIGNCRGAPLLWGVAGGN